MNYKKDLIAPDKQSLLEKLDGWTWNPMDDSWQEQYNGLHELAIANGNLNSLNLSKRMSEWISLQRKNYKKGILDEDKKISLEKIRGWSWNSIG